MGVRDKLTGNSIAAVGTTLALFIAAAVVFHGYFSSAASNRHGDPFSAFYSDDDGQTYFKDSTFKFPPFDHNGKTAYGALVYSDGDRKFVAYLVRFTPDTKKQLEDAYTNPPGGQTGATAALLLMESPQIHSTGVEIKKVGGDWMPGWKMGRPSVQASDGTPAEMVRP